jgi:O-antigen/teichoic acid export membrane protein
VAKESRIKKSLLNARVNMICYFISLLVAFFTRKIFLDKLGVDFIGLTGTLQSLLGFLNLAELGVGAAIGYVLYRPLYDDNRAKINEIISVFGYLYRYIGLFILSIGIILSLFLPLIFPDTPFSFGIIYLGFYAYLISSLLGYFINYRQTLLSADQRNYEVTGYYQAVTSTKMVTQMVLAIFVRSFILYFIIEFVFGLIYSFILTARINKVYPWLESEIKLGKLLFKKYPEIAKYIKQLFVHKIGEFAQGQITPIMIYSYISLPMVALYGNYSLLVSKINGLIRAMLDGTNAGVGNLILEGNKQKIWSTYKELFAARSFVAGIMTGCTYFSISNFIHLWLGENYVLNDSIVLLICIQLYMSIVRGVNDQFIFGFGLFYDTWAPIAETAIFILTAIGLGPFFGLKGVLLAPISSLLIIIYGWRPYFLFSRGLKLPLIKFWGLLLFYTAVLILSYLASRFFIDILFSDSPVSWIIWIIQSAVFAILITIVQFVSIFSIINDFRIFIYRLFKVYKI